MKTLFKYQQDIVDKATTKSVPLFMGMGTGKTVTSLNIFKNNPTNKILIICLISKMNDWKEDLQEECNIDAVILNKGSAKNKKMVDTYGNVTAFIVNFESAWRCDNLLKWVDNNATVLIDESHLIKNPTSKIGRFCRLLSCRTKYKLILTGTPQSQGYIDYYNQLYFCDIMNMSFKQFKDTYCIYEDKFYNGFRIKELIGYRKEKELEDIIQNNCIFYERKPDENLIPEDIVQHFEKPKAYDSFRKVRVFKDVIADNNGKLQYALRTICSGNIGEYEVDNQKIQWLSDFLDCTDDRVVIFYNFDVERDRIIKLLDKKKIVYDEYNGRRKSFNNFKANDKSVILCQYKSASTGINDLVVANVCVFYSLTNEYINFVQSKKRLDRIGQTKKPLFYYLICKNTVEEATWETLQQGKDFDDRMFEKYLEGCE